MLWLPRASAAGAALVGRAALPARTLRVGD
jgi:hypothetical protein